MNLDILLTSPLIPFVLALILAYWATKRIKKEVFSLVTDIIIREKATLKTELEAWINSETGQKAIYGIGAIAGSGIIAGTGFQKKSGKFKWQDLAAEVAKGWLEKKGFLGRERQTLNPETTPAESIPDAR